MEQIQEQPPNSTLNVKIDYIQRDIQEIKQVVKEIQSDFVSRREFNESLKAIRDEISPLKRFIYGIITVIGVAVVGALLNLILKK